MYKSILSFVIAFFTFCSMGNAQIMDPVQWTYSAKKVADKVYEVHITAAIGPKWHLYAQDAGEGPEPTKFSFAANPLISLDGKVKEVGKQEKNMDKNFNSVVRYYEKSVDFVQRIKVKSSVATELKGTLTFMVCNDRSCLPPKDIPFSVKIGGK